MRFTAPMGDIVRCGECGDSPGNYLDCERCGYVASRASLIAAHASLIASTTRLTLLEAVVAALPTCEKQAHPEASNSPYICKRFATRTTVLDGDDPSYTRAFCDEHVPRFMRADDLVDLDYAEALRALEAAR